MTTLTAAQDTKAAFFARTSGHRRTLDDLRAIEAAAYHVHRRYAAAEALYESWAAAPLPADRIPLYIRAHITVREARDHWEPQHDTASTQTTAALTLLAALSTPDPGTA